MSHHDALEFPDGEIVLLTRLCEGQRARVLQLPAIPRPVNAAHAQRRDRQLIGLFTIELASAFFRPHHVGARGAGAPRRRN